jgi:hypothetical protein
LNINSGIKKDRQDCKISTVGQFLWGGWVNGGDGGEGIWLMGFIYIYETE